MRGLSPDDAAEREEAVNLLAGLLGEGDGRRDLEASRHGMALISRAGRFERRDSTLCQLVGDILIEPSFDDHDVDAHAIPPLHPCDTRKTPAPCQAAPSTGIGR